jgi:hypothetical protein
VVKAGDVFTLAGVFRVHPETKASSGQLQQFVVTADASSNAGGWSCIRRARPAGTGTCRC